MMDKLKLTILTLIFLIYTYRKKNKNIMKIKKFNEIIDFNDEEWEEDLEEIGDKEIIERKKVIKVCNKCYFFINTQDGPSCSHPYWKDKGAWDNMLSVKEIKNIPFKCPLKKYDVVVRVTLEKK